MGNNPFESRRTQRYNQHLRATGRQGAEAQAGAKKPRGCTLMALALLAPLAAAAAAAGELVMHVHLI